MSRYTEHFAFAVDLRAQAKSPDAAFAYFMENNLAGRQACQSYILNASSPELRNLTAEAFAHNAAVGDQGFEACCAAALVVIPMACLC